MSDLDASLRFYCEGLGFAEVAAHEVGEEFGALMELDRVRLRSRMIARDGVTIELLGFDSPGVTGDGSRRPMNALGLTHLSLRVDDLEAAVRSCCEPIFDRPLKDISFGYVLLRLFQTSRRFNIEVQPQLVLLQKTLLNIEGLGRQLDPELDLWKTAKPYLENWMGEQMGWSGLLQQFKTEAPHFAHIFPQLPRLVHQALTRTGHETDSLVLAQLLQEQRTTNQLLKIFMFVAGGMVLGLILAQFLSALAE